LIELFKHLYCILKIFISLIFVFIFAKLFCLFAIVAFHFSISPKFGFRFSSSTQEFSGPEIDPNDIIITDKISEDERSSYGAVLKGYCYGCAVAIKVLRDTTLPENEQLLEGFKEEVKLMSEITHPNVCLFLGACFGKEVMLVTELLEGDLIHLLQSPEGKKFSLYKKCRCARDIAQGLAWLHHIQIAHLDLKPSNILYDSNYRCKVADFGLARLKSEDGYIPGACGGTPLYSAPEVLMKEDFTDKADVYSYALIFAFILTGKEPYPEFSAWDSFFNAVVSEGVRPPLPKHTPKNLARLIQSCWAFDPDERPSFIEVLPILELVLLGAAVEDPHGRQLWKTFFFQTKTYDHCTVNKLMTHVDWADFMSMLEAVLDIPPGPMEQPGDLNNAPLDDDPTEEQLYVATDERLREYARLNGHVASQRVDDELRRRNRIVELQCMETLLSQNGTVAVDRFGFICKLFGPINYELTMLHTMADTMNQSWFHGDMTSTEAYAALRDKKPGSFLVRFSTSEPKFCVSMVVSKSNKQQLSLRPSTPDREPRRRESRRSKVAQEVANEQYDKPRKSSSTGTSHADSPDNMRRTQSHAPYGKRPAHIKAIVDGMHARPLIEELQDLDAVVHLYVERTADGFRFPKSSKHFDTIVELIENNKQLTKPCSVGKKRFGYIFSSTKASHFGYLNPDDHRLPFTLTLKSKKKKSEKKEKSNDTNSDDGSADGSKKSRKKKLHRRSSLRTEAVLKPED